MQLATGPVNGVLVGNVTEGTLDAYANNRWNPGFNVAATPTSLPHNFDPTSVAINGVQCKITN